VQQRVVLIVARLVAQKIAVGTGVAHRAVGFRRVFAERKRDGAVGEFALDRTNGAADLVNGDGAAFAALQDERAEAERIAFTAAGKDLVGAQTVAAAVLVGAADAVLRLIIMQKQKMHQLTLASKRRFWHIIRCVLFRQAKDSQHPRCIWALFTVTLTMR
jgi:hypothetical protein